MVLFFGSVFIFRGFENVESYVVPPSLSLWWSVVTQLHIREWKFLRRVVLETLEVKPRANPNCVHKSPSRSLIWLVSKVAF